MDRVEFPALYTLQYGLAGNAETPGSLLHSNIALGNFFNETIEQRLSQTYLPRRVWCNLYAGDEAIVQPAVEG